MIQGGYYIKARKIQESEISHAPPQVREIWDWFLLRSNHSDFKGVKRGSLFTSIPEIQWGLRWYVGYRKVIYSKSKCEMALNWLRKRGMIETTKTTRGLIISICKYDIYQNPKNYETNIEKFTKPTRDKQTSETIYKNKKKEKNDEVIDQSEKNPIGVKKDFIDLVINEFVAEHGDYVVLNRGKEREAAGKLLSIYKKQFPDKSSEEALISIRAYFKNCININDEWLRNHMSLSIITSKFNEINKILKNGNTKGTGATDKELRELFQAKYGINSREL